MTPLLSESIQRSTCEGIVLTPDFLAQTMEDVNGNTYHRHSNGGGWVADSSLVLPELFVRLSLRIGPHTRLLDDKNLAGLFFIQGEHSRPVAISRVITERDRRMLIDQKICRIMRRAAGTA